jgi:tripartite-type tricarboxylate transporter receptor subunit TctC
MSRREVMVAVLALVLLILVLSACTPQAAVPDFPTKNITIVVPYKAGGGFDLQARLIAPFLEKYLPKKVNVIIQNVEGAGGRLGVSQFAKSKPDGYTLSVVGLETVAFMSVLEQLDDDPQNWTMLGQLSSDAPLVAVNAKTGLDSPAAMKGKDFRFGVTSENLPVAAVITTMIGSNYRPVLFDGSGDVILATTRGDVDVVYLSWPSMLKGVRDSKGALKSVFVINKTRLPAAPDVPTIEEMGVKPNDAQYAVLFVSRIIVAPAGMDKAIQTILVDAINKAEADPEFAAAMTKGGFEITTAKPDEVKTHIKLATQEFSTVKDMVKSYVR